MAPDKTPKIPVSIREVAQEAGVSTATVSRILNRNHRGALATRQRVIGAAERLGYRRLRRPPVRRAASRTSRGGDTGCVALLACRAIIARTQHPSSFYHRLWEGMQQRAREDKYYVIGCTEDPDASFSVPEVVRDRRCDGILLADHFSGDYVDHLIRHVPAVLVNNCVDWPAVDSVMADHWDTFFQSVGHLAGLGHRRIAYFDVDPALGSVNVLQQRQAYRQAIRHFRLEDDPGLYVPELFGMDEHGSTIAAAVDRYLRMDRPPTAVITADLYATFFVHEAAGRGIDVPTELSVVAIGDEMTEMVRPTLTSVRLPREQTGNRAMGLLLERIKSGRTGQAEHIRLATELIVRGSTAPPAGSDDGSRMNGSETGKSLQGIR